MRFHPFLAPLLIAVCAATGAISLTGARAEAETGGSGLTLFFMGERQSQIEPCGCIQKKLGGVQFEARLYEDRPRASSVRVDAGGFSSRLQHPEDSMRTRYAVQAMAGELDLDAINVAARDLTLGEAWFADIAGHFEGVGERLVSANIHRAGEDGADAPEPEFSPFRIVERTTEDGAPVRVLITGVATADGPGSPPGLGAALEQAGWTLAPAAESLGRVLASAPEHDLVIVMAATDLATATGLSEQFPAIDVVITSAMPRPGGAERRGPAALFHLPGSEGKVLARTELTPAGEGAWSASEADILEVSPDLEPAPVLVGLIESYKQSTEEMIVLKPRRTERVFGGARACGTCHVAEYEDWRTSRHARALDTLVDKGMQFDSRCLQCHTVGFGKDNGFYNVRESMGMAGVQCESCHGPAAEHVELEQYLKTRERFGDRPADFEEKQKRAAEVLPERQVAEAVCLACHTPDNDDHFVYDEKVHRVNHSGIAAAAGVGAGAAPH